MTHVKHLGWELETKVIRIAKALMWVPEDQRAVVIEHLSPIGLRRAVIEMFAS